MDKIVKKHAQGVGAAFGDLTTSCAEIQGELDALEPQWRAWVSTLQKKVAAATDVHGYTDDARDEWDGTHR